MRRHSIGATPSIGHVDSHPMEPETTSTCRRSFWKNKKNKENEPPVSYKNSPQSRRGSIKSIFRRNKNSSCLDEADAASSNEDFTSVYSGFSVITFDDDEIEGIIKSIGSVPSTPLAWSPSSQFRPKQGHEMGRRSSIN